MMKTLLQFVNLAILIGCQHLTQFRCLNAEIQVEKKQNLSWKTEEFPLVVVLNPAFENGSLIPAMKSAATHKDHDITPNSVPSHNNQNVTVKEEPGLGTNQSMSEIDLLHNTSKKLVRVKRFFGGGSSGGGGGGSSYNGGGSGADDGLGFKGVSYTLPPSIISDEVRMAFEKKEKLRKANRGVTSRPRKFRRHRNSSVQNVAAVTLILASVFIAFLFQSHIISL